MILSETDAKRMLEKILSYSNADSISLYLTGLNSYNLRFAVNTLSTNGYDDGLTLYLTSNFGKRSGSVSLNRFENPDIKEAVKRSEALSKIAPENDEFMPPLPPQQYLTPDNYSKDTESLSSDKRAETVAAMINKSLQSDVTSAGYFESQV